ncbi:MAG: sigma-70 family RNA polymerase sigma factor, partial [Dehalococcoidales bacterium]|nr:sigma-70 family RNA polymerase sigma factor [Dehalococcoidales bacterium]
TAFEALFRQYQQLVFKTAYLITGTREEAEDVLQEVFVSVWRSRHTFDPDKGKLTTWLHRITVNKCLERQRKKKLTSVSLERFDLPEAEASAGVPVDRAEQERLTAAMDVMDSKHRTVLVLRYFNELSYDEIAHTLGIPPGTVKSRINQALKLLRGQFDLQDGKTRG